MATPKHARYSRRTFLKGAGATAAGAAAVAVPAGAVAPATKVARPVAVRVGPLAGTPGTALTQVTVNGTLYEAA
ncbi:MAG: hypothetical protein AAB284_09075, partial [Chloroflexota bacterium]